MTRLPALALLCSVALAGCAPTARPGAPPQAGLASPRQCFFASNVNSWREAGEQAVHLRVGASQTWRLEFLGTCPEVEWAFNQIGLQQRGGGGAICTGMDVDVLINDAGFPRRCPVKSVRRLSEVEVAALPAGQRP